jgi:hypothetical protein
MMSDRRCAAPGCIKPARPNTNRCLTHANSYQRYGSDFGPGIKVRDLQAHYEEAAGERIEKLAIGGEKSQAALAWAEQRLRVILHDAAARLRSSHRWARKAAEFLHRLPADEPVVIRKLLVRLLATEFAVHGRRPAWREHHAEAINRGRLFAAGHGYVAPTSKFTLREIGQELMDSGLTLWCQRLIEHDEQRQEAARVAKEAALKALEESCKST